MKLNLGFAPEGHSIGITDKQWVDIQKSVQETDGGGFVYILKSGKYHKIGMTKYLEQRYMQLTRGVPFDCEYVFILHSNDYASLEKVLHFKCEPRRVEGTKEWFDLEKEDLELVKQFIYSWNNLDL